MAQLKFFLIHLRCFQRGLNLDQHGLQHAILTPSLLLERSSLCLEASHSTLIIKMNALVDHLRNSTPFLFHQVQSLENYFLFRLNTLKFFNR